MTTVIRKGIKWKNTKTILNEDVSSDVELDTQYIDGEINTGSGDGNGILTHATAFATMPNNFSIRLTSNGGGDLVPGVYDISSLFSPTQAQLNGVDIGLMMTDYYNINFDFGKALDTIVIDDGIDTGIRAAFWQYEAVATTGGTQVKRGFINACWNANTAGTVSSSEFGQVGTAPALAFRVFSGSSVEPYEVRLVAFVLDGYTYDIKLIRQLL